MGRTKDKWSTGIVSVLFMMLIAAVSNPGWPIEAFPEGLAVDYSAEQAKILRARFGDMIVLFRDAAGRPLENMQVVFEELGIIGSTDGSGELLVDKMIIGRSYIVTAEWMSSYGNKVVVRTSLEDGCEITMPVYDVTLKLLTPRGKPIVGAEVNLSGAYLGRTDAYGRITTVQVPAGSYAVFAEWLGEHLVLHTVNFTVGREVTLTPRNVHSLTVMVRGAWEQALEGAGVTILKEDFEVARVLTDRSGNVELELPDGEYTLEVSFDSFSNRARILLSKDSVVKINLDVFIKILGVGVTFSQFLLLTLAVAVTIIFIAIFIHE
ncbi:MAG: hypothetical protein ACUVQ0_01410 [Thermoproteota archaeon]